MPNFRTAALQFGVATLAVLLCVWAATQWAAAMLGYQPALGPAWITVRPGWPLRVIVHKDLVLRPYRAPSSP